VLVNKVNKDDEDFYIKYEVPGFEAFVRVYSDFTCKVYYTVYDPVTSDEDVDTLEIKAEEAALDKYFEQYQKG